jgi:hypothetical protein
VQQMMPENQKRLHHAFDGFGSLSAYSGRPDKTALFYGG